MQKFAKPLISVVAGIATSWSLQAIGVEPLYAKLAGLAAVGVLIYGFLRGSSAR